MKIVFITSKLDFENAGGSVVEIDLMMRELGKLGNKVKAVTVFSRINKIKNRLPYEVSEEDIKSAGLIGIQAGIYKIMKKYEKEADIFHIDGHLMLYGAGFYRFLGGRIPVFAYFNREILPFGENFTSSFQKKENFLRKYFFKLKFFSRSLIERFLLMPFTRFIDYSSFLNPILCREYYDFGLISARNGLIIGDPYPREEVMTEEKLSRDYYGKRTGKDGKITVFYSGRMVPGKGHDLFIRSLSFIKDKEKYKVILGGSGSEEKKVKEMIKDLKLENFIELTGWVDKKSLYENLKRTDIYVMARWRNDLSSVALTEALVFGLPSVVPSGGGLCWVVGGSGLTFNPEDPADLAEKIEKLGSDWELRKKLSLECYKRLSEPDLDYKQTVPAMNVIMKSLVYSPKNYNKVCHPSHPRGKPFPRITSARYRAGGIGETLLE